jgi:hypothetical protein
MGERGYVMCQIMTVLEPVFLIYDSQLLGDLEERINSLGQGSRSMAAQVMFFSRGSFPCCVILKWTSTGEALSSPTDGQVVVWILKFPKYH